MKNRVYCLAISFSLAALAAGCGKQKNPAPPPSTAAADAAPPAPADSPPPSVAPAAVPVNSEAELAAALRVLTQAVRKYSAEKQRVPSNLAEVVAAGYVTSMPAPSPGKKFVINRQLEVVLVRE